MRTKADLADYLRYRTKRTDSNVYSHLKSMRLA